MPCRPPATAFSLHHAGARVVPLRYNKASGAQRPSPQLPWPKAGSESLRSLHSKDLSLLGLGTCQAHTHCWGAESRRGEGANACIWRQGHSSGSFGKAGSAEQSNSIPKSSPLQAGRQVAFKAIQEALVPANTPRDRTESESLS